MIEKTKLIHWLNSLPEFKSHVGITEDGCSLRDIENPNHTIEIGECELEINDIVTATPKIGDFEHEFEGYISGICNNQYIVTDENGDEFLCDYAQIKKN